MRPRDARTSDEEHHTGPCRRSLGARDPGGAITRDLLGRGVDVATIVRTAADLGPLEALGAATRRADAAHPAALDDALPTAADRIGPLDVIVSAVAPARPPNDRTGFGGGAITEATLTGFDQWVVAVARQPKTARMTASVPPAAIVDPAGVVAAVHALASQPARAWTHKLVVPPAGGRWVS